MSTASERYPNLLSPISVGPMRLRHRAMMSGHGMHLGDGTGRVSDALRAYLVERALGGAALIGTESAPVHATSRNDFLSINLFDASVVNSLRRLADDVHEAGAKLSIILWHGGHNVSFVNGSHALAASPIPNLSREVPREISKKEILEIVKAYGQAAARCKEAGFDAVEVQTATSYLLGSFLSPAMNHRTDEYGGSFENRLRIVRQILQEIRSSAGGEMAVGVRTSTSHHIPNAPVDFFIEDSIAAMQALSEEGLVDWISILSGSRWARHETVPPMHIPRNHLFEEGKRYRRAVSVPVVIAGRIRTAADAEKIIAEGSADIVAMARTWIAEPEWALKVEQDREETIRPCMSCSQACAGFAFRGLPGTCVINPAAGRELTLGRPARSDHAKRIAIIGGGPAGLEAARVAALRGHRVVLYEADSRLGGQMHLAAGAPNRSEMLPAIDWWERELRRHQVEIVLEHPVPLSASLDVDETVWAVGGEPWHTAVWRLRPYLKDGIPGTERLPHGRQVMSGTSRVGGSVLIIDEEGGWPAISLAEYLHSLSGVSAITVVTSERFWGESDLNLTFELDAVTARIRRAGIAVIAGTVVHEVADGCAQTSSEERLGPYDSIVLSTGTRSRAFPEDAAAAGDCLAPRGIWAATHDAAVLARQI